MRIKSTPFLLTIVFFIVIIVDAFAQSGKTSANGWYIFDAKNCTTTTSILSNGYNGYCQSFRMEVVNVYDSSWAIWEKEVEPFARPDIFWYYTLLSEITPQNWTVYHQLYAGNDTSMSEIVGPWQNDLDFANVWFESIPGTQNCSLPDTITKMRIKIFPGKWGQVKTLEWRFDFLRRAADAYSLLYLVDNFGDDVTSVEQIDALPTSFELYQNYPNPFNPSTTIRFSLNEMSDVNLTIFNTLGEKVLVLVNEEKHPGTYETTFNGSQLPSGIYFYRLTIDGNVSTKKMLLLK